MHLMCVYIHENKSMMQYHLKFLEYSLKKYDAISSKVTGVIDVTRAPKFLGALKVVPKLVASDQKIGRSWMLVKDLNTVVVFSNEAPDVSELSKDVKGSFYHFEL